MGVYRTKKLWFSAAILWLATAGTLFGGEPLVIDQTHEGYEVNPHLEMLWPPAGRTQPSPAERKYIPFASTGRAPLTKELNWYRFAVDNRTGRAQSLILTNGFQTAGILLIRFPLAPLWTGFDHFDKQYKPSRYPSAKIDLPQGTSTFYLAMAPQGYPEIVSLKLTGEEAYLRGAQMGTFNYVAVFGIFLGVVVYHVILLLISIRNRLQFSTFIASSGRFLLTSSLAGLWTLCDIDVAVVLLKAWGTTLALLLAGFSLELLDIFQIRKNVHPKTHAMFMGLIWTFLALACLYPLFRMVITDLLIFLAFGAGGVYILFFLAEFKHINILNTLYALAIFPVILLLFVLGLAAVGVHFYDALINDVLFVAAMNACIFTAMTVGIRIRRFYESAYKTEHALSLGKSVQDLLLPVKPAGSSAGLSYLFRLAPCRGSMSGDWIQCWQNPYGDLCLLLGDVTGKGPQAAISVAAIVSIIDLYKNSDAPLAKVIEQVNASLFSLFNGKVNSTVTGITLGQRRDATLYNAGGLGWFLAGSRMSRHFGLRSDLLGVGPCPHIAQLEISLSPGDVLWTMTDGVCDNSVGFRRLMSKMKALNVKGCDIQAYFDAAWTMASKEEDDRAMLVVMGGETGIEHLVPQDSETVLPIKSVSNHSLQGV